MRQDEIRSAKVKIARYCAYQERSQNEVRDKLYKLGLYSDEVEYLVSELIGENFVNEERFSIAFIRGRFRLKHWGKVKIAEELKRKGISKNLIAMAMREIGHEEYVATLKKLANKKFHSLRVNDLAGRQKIANYLIGKGYEPDLVWDCIKEIDA